MNKEIKYSEKQGNGFKDEDFNKAKASGLLNTQLYKIVGNSIVVSCLYHIFRKLFIDFNEVKSSE